MSYDKKSDIGQFKSDPRQAPVNQVDIHRQQMLNMPLGNSSTSNMPLGKNLAKVIDMLSMEQFGYNTSIARKDLSIVDSYKANTDKEYGIIQIEDDFQLEASVKEDIVDDSYIIMKEVVGVDGETSRLGLHRGYVYGYPIQQSELGTEMSIDKIKQTIKHDSETGHYEPGYVIPNVQILERSNNQALINYQIVKPTDRNLIYNTVYKDTDDYPLSDLNQTGNLNSDNALKANTVFEPQGLGYQPTWFKLEMDNYDDVTVKMHLSTLKPDWYGSKDIGSGTSGTLDSGSLNTASFEGLGIAIEWTKDGTLYNIPFWVFGQATQIKQITVAALKPIGLSAPTARVSGEYWKYAKNNTTGRISPVPGIIAGWTILTVNENTKYPNIRMKLTIRSSNVTESMMVEFSDGVYDSIKEIVYIGQINTAIVRDWSYANYFLGRRIFDETVTMKPKALFSQTPSTGNENLEFMLTVPDGMNEYVYHDDSLAERPKFISYYKLIDIVDTLSIGIIEREDSTVQLGISYNGIYYTAKYDVSVEKDMLNIENIKVIETKNNLVCFIAKINGFVKYYGFHSVIEFDGGLLIDEYRDIYYFYAIDISRDFSKLSDITTAAVSPAIPLTLSTYDLDNNIYLKATKGLNVNAIVNGSSMFLNRQLVLRNSITELRGIARFAVKDTTIPLLIGIHNNIGQSDSNAKVITSNTYESGLVLSSIVKIPSISEDTKDFNSLPLRLIDEYPEIFWDYQIGTDSLVIGKERFVSVNGDLYNASTFSLVCNDSSPKIEGNGEIYSDGGIIFVSNDNLTKIYSYNELGFSLLFTIEDKILCSPVKSSVGILACGKNGIWAISDKGAIRIWSPGREVVQASLKTELDNCCVAILDNGDLANVLLVGESGSVLVGSSTNELSKGYPKFTVVTINQLGLVSWQELETDLTDAKFVDIGPDSNLVVVDLLNDNSIYNVIKDESESGDTYSITSNQNIEFYGEPVVSDLIKISVFAKGTGTIELYVKDDLINTVDISSTSYYNECIFELSNPMNMLNYTLVGSKGVKILQRILGVIIPREVFYV